MAGELKQFVLYKDTAGEFRWTLYAANARKIADGSEGYKNHADCLAGIRLVVNAIPGIQVYDKTKDQWYNA
ncbi:YegP family protein [Pseudoxanthomonas indica]|uniref:Uncharacterized conserved protein YegP, UPF0339 family n=1 Tax=Pseudoxanthomonas indica TaxID=428993 RepID=A0A1T5JET5_9GAMM|nr:DUF1508 domain-containing protein [Pseudoxanthomonas indica]GGD58179.1 hypothetical protein GCM10007235_33130 [Pseudoxanthomonas indica]SKC49742.1 Uncharacterized conserved protein YegP, UPF0339 family [Pseudoxanthomonas indica]